MLFLESAPAMKFNLGLVAKLQHTAAVFLAAANESLLTMITARFLRLAKKAKTKEKRENATT